MTPTSAPQLPVPSESQAPNLPVALMPLVLVEVPAPATPPPPVPLPSFEASDDRFYARHGGINE
jgi:hypothetical protein